MIEWLLSWMPSWVIDIVLRRKDAKAQEEKDLADEYFRQLDKCFESLLEGLKQRHKEYEDSGWRRSTSEQGFHQTARLFLQLGVSYGFYLEYKHSGMRSALELFVELNQMNLTIAQREGFNRRIGDWNQENAVLMYKIESAIDSYTSDERLIEKLRHRLEILRAQHSKLQSWIQ